MPSPSCRCVTPDFSQYAAGEVEVRVALNGDSFTTTSQRFAFFAVTDASKCVVYGPGVLSGCAVNEETMFVIQARDSQNRNRTTGGDEFKVSIRMVGGGDDGDDLYLRTGVVCQDLEDGSYIVTFTAPQAGDYVIEVEFAGTFGGASGHTRGSPASATFEEFVPRSNNAMQGKIMMTSVKAELTELNELTKRCAEGVGGKLKDEVHTLV